MIAPDLHIDRDRLLARIEALAEVGAIAGGGCCRLALTDEDRAGRDLVVAWMRELGLAVTVDRIGNVFGTRPGRRDGPPVMTGSHLDTVRTGGRYDGPLGVLAGLEIVQVLDAAGVETEHPLAVAVFTNEEGARFTPDMMGSLGYVGGLDVQTILDTADAEGETVGACLQRIGYDGDAPVGAQEVRAFVELHIEQGPVLEEAGTQIGVVDSLQGISWTEYRIRGVTNHAGTTPMRLRHDAGYAAAAIATEVRAITRDFGGNQVGTVGALELEPNAINVVADAARVTVDLRNTDEAVLQQAEARLANFVQQLADDEGVEIDARSLVRFEPVVFDPALVDRVEARAQTRGLSTRRMPSGAGHDAQMLARVCPTAMIFTPSVGGISHNVREYTAPADIEAGANVLLDVLVELLER